ncbi:aspartate/glutamate racemase family protein [Halobacterium wangiae]|uniref:aspartate/glutamate racemase family protein n=1 Tax=Halobacterium wangiae TaxID=2902623 RepID=UPI001E333852|nr:aspartate/glutamate racemase family protein [Halobacterium wangiae]
MVSIAYLVPGTGLPDEEKQRRETVANDLVPADVSVIAAEDGPKSIESTIEEEWAVTGLARLVDRHEDEFDGFVIGCFGDPGLASLRELTRTPVVGPAETAFHTAAQVADTFACLDILDATEPQTHRMLREYGLSDRASVRVVDAPVGDIDHDSSDLIDRMIRIGRVAVEEDGADALVPGCMSLAFMQAGDEIGEELGVPFVDPVAISLETATTWARHGLTHSPTTYHPAPREKLGGLLDRSPPVDADD